MAPWSLPRLLFAKWSSVMLQLLSKTSVNSRLARNINVPTEDVDGVQDYGGYIRQTLADYTLLSYLASRLLQDENNPWADSSEATEIMKLASQGNLPCGSRFDSPSSSSCACS